MSGGANGMRPMELILKPIGFVTSSQKEPYQAARQPDEDSQPATIQLVGNEFLPALQDLSECSHVWLIFGFHHNAHWKPLVQTPRSDRKIGVFATRAPYRPNPLGLSCVPLLAVDHLTLKIGPNDLLDGTPIYDIKPYLEESDSVSNTRIGWIDTATHPKMKIHYSPVAESDLDYLERLGVKELRPFIKRQLEYDPTNTVKKRVEKNASYWTLSYRTWRIDFLVASDEVGITALRSGYSSEEISHSEDIYQDKEIHRQFIKYQSQ